MWWMGITGPANFPWFVLETWNNALVKVVKNPEFVSKAENMGMSFFSRIHWRLGILRRKRLKRQRDCGVWSRASYCQLSEQPVVNLRDFEGGVIWNLPEILQSMW
jgi:hypothetical protein